jgi:hypothetical protein
LRANVLPRSSAKAVEEPALELHLKVGEGMFLFPNAVCFPSCTLAEQKIRRGPSLLDKAWLSLDG